MAIEVKKEDFELNVIQHSQTRPVLVDFWASWCNPCRVLGPILDKLEEEYQGRFLLVKVNTETQQELAIRYKVNSIPFVALFHKGIVKDSFTGALNHNLVRNFLDKNLPHPSAEEIRALIQNSSFEVAGEKIISENLKGEIFDEYLWKIFMYYLEKNKNLDNLKKYINQMSDFGSRYSEIKSVLMTIHKNTINNLDMAAILKIFEIDKKSESLEYFLNKIEETSGTEKDKHKNLLFLCFYILDKDPLVNEYRKKLSRILF